MVTGFELRGAREQPRLAAAPFHEWAFPDGTPWARFHRTARGYLVRFPELADFAIEGEPPRVACHPAPEVTPDTCEHLYLNQVLPLVLSRRGELVFHAAAVAAEGAAIAFLGESGRGKSTLAASFAAAGHAFLSDDGLAVAAGASGAFEAIPGHASIRLWKDSERALMGAGVRPAPAVQYTGKARFLAGGELAHCARALPLRRAYFLGEAARDGISIEPLASSEALVEWVRNSFVLDPDARPALASHFDRLARLANGLAAYRLDYPRRFEALGAVRAAILAHLGAPGP